MKKIVIILALLSFGSILTSDPAATSISREAVGPDCPYQIGACRLGL